MLVGLFGGSFDPPHAGHHYVASKLMRLLQLNEVWWVVVESNCLKSPCKYSMEERVVLLKNLIGRYRDMRVVEVDNTRGYGLVSHFKRKYPRIKFVWIAGSDNLITLHKWYRWRAFCEALPIIFLERGGYLYRGLRMPFAVSLSGLYSPNLRLLLHCSRGWSVLRSRSYNISSTQIRNSSG